MTEPARLRTPENITKRTNIADMAAENPLYLFEDSDLFPEIQRYVTILTESQLLRTAQAKKAIRETQNELSSAWKFYMGLGTDKQVLVIVDGFTTLPLSLARNSAHVVVYGLAPGEVELLQNLAVNKKISNYSCVSELGNLATQFDIIVLSSGSKAPGGLSTFQQQIQKFVHKNTEVWLLTRNARSKGFAKTLLHSLLRKKGPEDFHDNTAQHARIRMQFDDRPLLSAREGREFMRKLDCKPFALIGILPSVLRMKTARPLRDDRVTNFNGAALSTWQSLGASEIAIGATRYAQRESLLQRLITSLPRMEQGSLRIKNYRVSSSGKVLVFVEYKHSGETRRAVIKLPLNEFASRRLQLNHDMLEFLAGARPIGEGKKGYFPAPLHKGSFERQAYFAESILEGESGGTLPLSRKDRERLIHEIFSFWISLQQSLAHEIYFDEVTFTQQIEQPFRQTYELGARHRNVEVDPETIVDYLRRHFLHQKFRLSLIHGDFSFRNLIFTPEILTLKGVVDWDMARELCFPLLDVFHFFIRCQRISYKKSPIHVLGQLLTRRDMDRDFKEILDMYLDTFGIEENLLQALGIIYWVQRFSAHLGTLKLFDEGFMRRNFDEPLQYFKNLRPRTPAS